MNIQEERRLVEARPLDTLHWFYKGSFQQVWRNCPSDSELSLPLRQKGLECADKRKSTDPGLVY